MKEIKYTCEAEETSEQKTARAMSIHMYSGHNPDGDKDTSDNRIRVAETLNRVLAQTSRTKKAVKRQPKPQKASAGDIAVAQYQGGFYDRQDGEK
jgi:hypothetical protein